MGLFDKKNELDNYFNKTADDKNKSASDMNRTADGTDKTASALETSNVKDCVELKEFAIKLLGNDATVSVLGTSCYIDEDTNVLYITMDEDDIEEYDNADKAVRAFNLKYVIEWFVKGVESVSRDKYEAYRRISMNI